MCDTFIDVSDQRVIFGKNSDREPNEAQQIVLYPRFRRKTIKQTCTFISVDHPQEIFEVILSKPFQMFGAEMGCNEWGVTIGNEAVFTKIPIKRTNSGLTGMDLIRLSLEISKTAHEALHHIIFYLEKYGQDACGGYKNSNFYYHNSFLIADTEEGYLLETAGKHWVYKKIYGFAAISNGLTIGGDFDEISKGTKDYAFKRGWIKDDFNFSKAYSQFWLPRLASCEYRKSRSENIRNSDKEFSVKEAFALLRQHKEPFSPQNAGNDSICMHASGILCRNSTVGSMVAELKKDKPPTIWLTGTSTPCLSLFKPFFLGSDILTEENFLKPGPKNDNSYWWKWETFFRNSLHQYSEAHFTMKQWQADLETNWLSAINSNSDMSANALEKSNEVLALVDSIIYPKKKLGLYFDLYRKKLNKQAGIA